MSKPDSAPSTALATVGPAPAGMMALEPRNIADGMQLAKVAAATQLFGVKTPEDAFVRMATGMGLGLSAWQSLRGLFVISGKVGLAADLMLALCRTSPDCEYFKCVETTAERATFKAKRHGEEEMTLSFTMADAKTAGLTGNSMYQKYPANMLRARGIAFLARLMFPERMHGILTREEIESIEEERVRGAAPVVVDPLAATSDHIERSFAAGRCPLCDGQMGPGKCERRGAELVCRRSTAPSTEGRSTILSPPPDALRAALASWQRCEATDEEIDVIAASPDANHRAMVFGWRIEQAESLEELAKVATDITADPHEEMRGHMLGVAEKRRAEMAVEGGRA